MSLAASAEIAGSQYLPLLPSSWPQKVLKVAGQRHEQCLSGKLGPMILSTWLFHHNKVPSFVVNLPLPHRTETYRAIMSYPHHRRLGTAGENSVRCSAFLLVCTKKDLHDAMEAVAVALKISKSVAITMGRPWLFCGSRSFRTPWLNHPTYTLQMRATTVKRTQIVLKHHFVRVQTEVRSHLQTVNP